MTALTKNGSSDEAAQRSQRIDAVNSLFKSGRLAVEQPVFRPRPVHDHWLDAVTCSMGPKS